MERRTVALDRIRIDGNTQPRVAIDATIVAEYAIKMRRGLPFQAVMLFFDGLAYWLADGFHRYHAAHAAGRPELLADVQTGTVRDAILYSVGANEGHGIRRTAEDKHKAVMTLLHDEEWSEWSDSKLAQLAAVDDKTVSAVRASLRNFRSETSAVESRRYVTKHGTPAVMRVGRIGPRTAPERAERHRQLREFADAGLSMPDIAAKLGITVGAVWYALKSAGITLHASHRHASPPTAVARRDQIRDMAAAGYSQRQVAERLQISEDAVRVNAKAHGITFTRAVYKTARIDSNRVMTTIVMDAENLTTDVGLVTFAALDRSQIQPWINSLERSRLALARLIRQLRQEGAHHDQTT